VLFHTCYTTLIFVPDYGKKLFEFDYSPLNYILPPPEEVDFKQKLNIRMMTKIAENLTELVGNTP